MHSPYPAKNYERLVGMPGFSDKLLRNHFKLYEGYVANTNKFLGSISLSARSEEHRDSRSWELRRRFGWEFNGMRLHELYFENLGKESGGPSRTGAFAKKVSENFFSFETWKKDFSAVGAMRGVGWVMLVYDHVADCLMNLWINEHDTGHLAGAEPILVMDVFEHAFMTDYGLEKDKYIASFWNAVRWEEVQRRFEQAKEEPAGRLPFDNPSKGT